MVPEQTRKWPWSWQVGWIFPSPSFLRLLLCFFVSLLHCFRLPNWYRDGGGKESRILGQEEPIIVKRPPVGILYLYCSDETQDLSFQAPKVKRAPLSLVNGSTMISKLARLTSTMSKEQTLEKFWWSNWWMMAVVGGNPRIGLWTRFTSCVWASVMLRSFLSSGGSRRRLKLSVHKVQHVGRTRNYHSNRTHSITRYHFYKAFCFPSKISGFIFYVYWLATYRL